MGTDDVEVDTDQPEEEVIEEKRETIEVEIPEEIKPVEEDIQVPLFKETIEVQFEKTKIDKVPVFEETIQFETKTSQKVETSTEEIVITKEDIVVEEDQPEEEVIEEITKTV